MMLNFLHPCLGRPHDILLDCGLDGVLNIPHPERQCLGDPKADRVFAGDHAAMPVGPDLSKVHQRGVEIHRLRLTSFDLQIAERL
jgi:hypothetical protein